MHANMLVFMVLCVCVCICMKLMNKLVTDKNLTKVEIEIAFNFRHSLDS